MRKTPRRDLIISAVRSGKTRNQIYAQFLPLVEAQVKPWIFTRNPEVKGSGPRVPKDMADQQKDLLYEINRCIALIEKGGDYPATPEAESSPVEIEEEEDSEEVTPEVKPVAAGKKSLRDKLEFLHREIVRIRKFCVDREMSGESVDKIGMRLAEAGGKLIPAGIPPEALLAAAVFHWPEVTRRDAQIHDFDFEKLSREIMDSRGIVLVTRADGTEEIPHPMFGYCLVLVENRQPVYAYGAHGTGKSHLARQIADFLGLPYAEAPLSPGATRGDFLGRHTAAGFVAARFVEIYSGGGVFNFEEIDSADPAMLLVLNNALAGKSLYNTLTGETHERHPDFCAFATANTLGLGANRTYTGREKIDAATLDRWNCGRVELKVNEKVERSLLGL